MAEILSCPGCGKDDIRTHRQIINRKTNKPARTWLVFLGGGIAALFGLLMLLSAIKELTTSGMSSLFYFGIVMAAVFLIPSGIAFYNYFSGEKFAVDLHRCAACGREWQTRPEDTWVKATCPECGSTHIVQERMRRLLPGTEDEIGAGSLLLNGLLGFLGAVAFVAGGQMLLSPGGSSNVTWTWAGIEISEQIAGLIFAAGGGAFALGGIGQFMKYRGADIARLLSCDECEHVFEVRQS